MTAAGRVVNRTVRNHGMLPRPRQFLDQKYLLEMLSEEQVSPRLRIRGVIIIMLVGFCKTGARGN